jgi:hypothetical protein
MFEAHLRSDVNYRLPNYEVEDLTGLIQKKKGHTFFF